MWHLTISWWELVLRAFIVYGFLLLALRLTGKRQIGQLAPFDLVLLLVLSNSVQNSMNGGDNSITAGILTAATLLLLNGLIGWFTYRSKKFERIIEGRPELLIHNGILFPEILEQERLTHHELNAALRAVGCTCVHDVHYAIIENTGHITVQPKKRGDNSADPAPKNA